jgi:hypothetical protein
MENGTKLLVTMANRNDTPEEVRGQFQWMSGLFGNIQTVIEQDLSEGKITL